VRLQLPHALVALVLVVPACTRASSAEPPPPARRSPVAVPSAPPSETEVPDASAPAELIDPSSAEELAMSATSTLTIAVGGTTTRDTLVQSTMTDTVLEQNGGETERVLRLNTAGAKNPDDLQFSVEGRAATGTFKTGDADLRVVFYDAKNGVDLLSDSGDCTVVFDRVDATGAAGAVSCANIDTPTGKAQLAATFEAKTTAAP
jgi:hypothetical protein